MATKDWKKSKVPRTSLKDIEFNHNRSNKRILIIKMYSKDYIVDIGYGKVGTFNKPRFKTKSRALKFAKSYMRKH